MHPTEAAEFHQFLEKLQRKRVANLTTKSLKTQASDYHKLRRETPTEPSDATHDKLYKAALHLINAHSRHDKIGSSHIYNSINIGPEKLSDLLDAGTRNKIDIVQFNINIQNQS